MINFIGIIFCLYNVKFENIMIILLNIQKFEKSLNNFRTFHQLTISIIFILRVTVNKKYMKLI